MKIEAKAKFNKLFDVTALRKEILDGFEKVKKPTVKDYESTIKYFKEKPAIKTRLSIMGNTYSLLVYPSGNTKIWEILNSGAKRRKALMSPDYKPGTIPNTVKTRRSKGEVLVVSNKIKGKSIEPRNWTSVIAKRNAPIFQRAMRQALKNAMLKRK